MQDYHSHLPYEYNSLFSFQKKIFQLKNYDDEYAFTIDELNFVTSSKNNDNEQEYYLLNNLNDYLISNILFIKDSVNKGSIFFRMLNIFKINPSWILRLNNFSAIS